MNRFQASMRTTVAACSMLFAAGASAQAARPPAVQYWMDVATYTVAGMEDQGGLMASMMSNMVKTSGPHGRDGRKPVGVGNFGFTKVPSGLGRYVDIAVFSSRKPAGVTATQQLPAGARLGASPLQIVTPPRDAIPPGEFSENREIGGEMFKGRILFYWGCSTTVRQGQPRVLDLNKLSAAEYGAFLQGRAVRDRGARAEAGHGIWPNDAQNSRVDASNSLLGTHHVSGDGLPADLRFTLPEGYDMMPPLRINAAGNMAQSINLTWGNLPSARAYLMQAVSSRDKGPNGPEVVMWSSSELPEPGHGLMDYISNANVDRWTREKVLLPAGTTSCAIPQGIFNGFDGGMVSGIAYGNEFNTAQPKPAGAPASWSPEWAVRVRYKSHGMAILGMEDSGSSGSRRTERQQQRNQPSAAAAATEALGNVGGAIGGFLKGLGSKGNQQQTQEQPKKEGD